jgi:hypothetical protein
MTFMAQDTTRLEINTAFRAAAIPCLWVKGSALAYTVYPAPELRPMGDLDVLVPPGHFEQAATVLFDLGYRPPDQAIITLPPELVDKYEHHLLLRGGAGGGIFVELHWRLLNQMLLDTDQGAWFWSQTQEIEIHDQTLTTLQPEAHLLYLCAHVLLQHGEAVSLLMHYLDLHLLLTHSPINWSSVVDQAVRFKWTYTVERALMTASNTFDTPVPTDVLEALRQKRPDDEVLWQVDRLAGTGNHFERVWRLMQGEPMRSKRRLITAIVFPVRTYMRARYAVPPGQALWPWYLRRWANQGLGVWRAIQSRWPCRRG